MLCKRIFSSVHSETRGHEYSMPSRVSFSFGTRDFPTKRLSETTTSTLKTSVEIYHESTCFVEKKTSICLSVFVVFCRTVLGNDKALSETTKVCRKQQSLVGNDKGFARNDKAIFDPELSK